MTTLEDLGIKVSIYGMGGFSFTVSRVSHIKICSKELDWYDYDAYTMCVMLDTDSYMYKPFDTEEELLKNLIDIAEIAEIQEHELQVTSDYEITGNTLSTLNSLSAVNFTQGIDHEG